MFFFRSHVLVCVEPLNVSIAQSMWSLSSFVEVRFAASCFSFDDFCSFFFWLFDLHMDFMCPFLPHLKQIIPVFYIFKLAVVNTLNNYY